MRRRDYLAGAGAVCVGGVAAAGADRSGSIERRGSVEQLIVAPETTILFEISRSDEVEPADIEWDLGDLPGGGLAADLEYETGDGVRSVRFEELGTYEISASHEDTTVRWDVTVDDDGAGPPTIESIETDPRPGETVGIDDSVEVTATAVDPEGDLDRLVWVEGRNYLVVEIDEIDGDRATATLSLDETPHWIDFGYPTVAYPVCADGRLGERATSDGPAVRQPFDVEIVETNAPVAAGERFSATVAVENVGDMMMVGPDTQEIALVVGDEVVDSKTVSLGWAEETQLTLGYETYPVAEDVSFSVRVEGEDDADSVDIEVYADSENGGAGRGTLSVDISGTNAPVTGGERLEVLANVGSDGSGDATGPIELVVGGEVVDTRSIELPAGSTDTVALGYETYPVRRDVDVTLTVRTPDDAASTTVPVRGRD
ncbi:hypothetical protein [Halovivax gelatinilyticus]|uniref:hypothetical protein n=1 Tax=Halovivax gelatinilyticus TaxID=2961597 RepID=UPI0020CA6C3C|nr:hypothetical protein [Halovivax gelatinilyticus]